MKGAGASGNLPSGERLLIDFSTLDRNFCFTLGRVNYSRAHTPLENHTHKDRMEIVLMVKGRQVYQVGGRNYAVGSGEVFMTFANELHGTSGYPEDKSLLYYLIIAVDDRLRSFIGFDGDESAGIIDRLKNPGGRKFPAIPKLKHELDAMISVYYGNSPFRRTLIRGLISGFLIDVVNCAKNGETCSNSGMKPVLEYIRNNIDKDIRVPDLAKTAGLSVPGFKARFRNDMGMPPREYVLRQKVETAKEMLKSRDLSITDIAYKLSFSSSQYFSTVFKRYTFKSPANFRASL